MASSTLNGFKWSTFNTIVKSIFQIIILGVMSRLLEKETFGLLAMAQVVTNFAAFFSNIGIGRALVQKKEISKDEIDVGFTYSIILGIVTFLVLLMIAPIGELVFNNAEIVPVIRVMGIMFVFSSISSIFINLLQRDLNFKSIAMIESTSYVVGYGCLGVILAFLDFGIWSLVFANIFQPVLVVFLGKIAVKKRFRLNFQIKQNIHIFTFGAKASVLSIIEFFSLNIDTFFIGRMLGTYSLGIYNRSNAIINQPVYSFVLSITRVLFPSYSKIQNDKNKLKEIYLSTIFVISVMLTAVSAGIIISAKEITIVVLSTKWLDSVNILKLVALVITFRYISHVAGVLYEAIARFRIKYIIQISTLGLIVILFYLLKSYGLAGFIIAVLITNIARTVFYSIDIYLYFNVKLREYAFILLSCGISFSVTYIWIYLIKFMGYHIGLNSIFILILEMLAGASSLILLIAVCPLNTIESKYNVLFIRYIAEKRSNLLKRLVRR